MKSFLRSQSFNLNNALQSLIRGPKKKKGAAGGTEAAASEDITNIFKDREDPELKPINHYPIWLSNILDGQKDIGEVIYNFEADDDLQKVPTSEVKRLMRQIKRILVKDSNYQLNMQNIDFEYEPRYLVKDIFYKSKEEIEELRKLEEQQEQQEEQEEEEQAQKKPQRNQDQD